MKGNKKRINRLYSDYVIRRSQDVLRLASIIKESKNFTGDDYRFILEKTKNANSSQHIISLIEKHIKPLVYKNSISKRSGYKILSKIKNKQHNSTKGEDTLVPIQKLMVANNKVYNASDFIFKQGLIICDGFKLKTVRAKHVDSSVLKNIDATFRINATHDGSFYFNPATDLSRIINLIDSYYNKGKILKINRGIEILHTYIISRLKSIRKRIESGELDVLIPADSMIKNSDDKYGIFVQKINLQAHVSLSYDLKVSDIIKYEIINAVGPDLFDTVIWTYIKKYPLSYDISDIINKILCRTKINIDNRLRKIFAVSNYYRLIVNHNYSQITSIVYDERDTQYVSFIHIMKIETCINENKKLLKSKELYRGYNLYDYLVNKLRSLHTHTSDIKYLKIDNTKHHPFQWVRDSIEGAYIFDDRNDHYSDISFNKNVKCILIECCDNSNSCKHTFFELYTNDKTKSVYRFICETKNRSKGLFIIWSYFTAYINNKRECYRDYEDIFQVFGVRISSKLDPVTMPAPYIRDNYKYWDSLFSLDIRVELN